MAQSLPSCRRKALEKQLAQQQEEYEALNQELGYTQDAATRLQIKRHMTALEQEMAAVSQALKGVTTTPPDHQPSHQARSRVLRLLVAGVVVVALVLVAAILIQRLIKTPTPVTYVVRVEGQNGAGTGIKDAKVTLEVPGRPPLDAFTDSTGMAVITVPDQYVGGSAIMMVEAPGFTSFRQNIRVDAGALPPLVRLLPLQQP
jgi:uncharacterized coiled-coil protein SlyX